MNILFHHRTRGRGAEGVHIRGVVKGLTQLGHTVSILSLPGAEPEAEEQPTQANNNNKTEKKSGFSLLSEITKHVPEFVFEMFELAYNLLAVFRLKKAVQEKNIKLIYERYSLFMFAGVWWAKRNNVDIILEINDSCQVHRVRALTFKKLAAKIERWVFKNATGLVFISSRFQAVARQAYGDIAPSVVSPNAADLDKFIIDKPAGTALRKALGINDKLVLGYVGAFVHWHGIDWFVEMICPHLSKHPNLVLLLVGDGVAYEPIKAHIAQAGVGSQVILTGKVEHQKVASYLSAMDFGILPDSNDYGSPMKLFEFMAMGKGMVAPDFSPIAEVVTDHKTSWLFPAGDRQACIEKVLDIARDPLQHSQVGNLARRYIEEERQWRHNAEQLLSLLKPEVN
ncbi:Glycosyltransferase involved in cell wall bisynthesis [Colwellia chukchiensis]|uniref:Glycosyltransferase involved in cell wall bisynthesis n=1 Tax=Colwellia chukchiensis TaxID=641665 RepID=A0A1H7SDY1_9GAMM|nr:glycosyltransferase family 4 protein [Colwellia chukchiensis]SEL70608.1 Glycosyltransferase involved in cell wall bisynthesis [Colwellia chukchiensis]